MNESTSDNTDEYDKEFISLILGNFLNYFFRNRKTINKLK